MKEEIQISIPKENEEEMKALLSQAAEVFNKTESDLENLKNSTWYKRLFEAVTFQKNNEKVIVHNITQLVDLQNIIVRIILIMLGKSTDIAEIVERNSDAIEKLYGNQENTIRKLKKLCDNIKYGYTETIDIRNIENKYKSIFLYVLNELAKNYSQSEKSQKFLDAFFKYLGYFDFTEKENTCLENLGKEESAALYTVCMSYLYYVTESFDLNKNTETLFDELAVSKSMKNSIEDMIKRECELYGNEVLVGQYSIATTNNISLFEIDDSCFSSRESDFYDTSNTGSQKKRLSITEDTVVSGIVTIPYEEEYVYKNCSVHFEAKVNCKGTVYFENVKIYYGKKGGCEEIILNNDAAFIMKNCDIYCESMKENHFIKMNSHSDQCKIEFQDCKFYDCTYFLYGFNFDDYTCYGNVSFSKCRFYNCEKLFIEDVQDCQIEESAFFFNRPPYENKGKEHIFHCQKLQVKKTSFSSDSYRGIFNIQDSLGVENCSFENISNKENIWSFDCNCILKLKDSHFLKCRGIINNIGAESKIENCIFTECANIIFGTSTSTISNCTFKDCTTPVMSMEGQSNISFCMFEGIQDNCIEDENSFVSDMFETNTQRNVLGFYQGTIQLDEKSFCSHTVQRCMFKDCVMKKGYLVAVLGCKERSPRVKIEGCQVVNCHTDRTDKSFITTSFWYYKSVMSHKPIKMEADIQIKNCQGM
ncbi:MAG: right-handed parallel beta-helix repeat-containing protein [Treponemataceae bacterium]|nr:right-handed parallel beta-helix repeat-containing protein [Treponemataceae bacterium]